jgi:hypothetical protein
MPSITVASGSQSGPILEFTSICLDLVNMCALVLLKNEEADQKDKGQRAGWISTAAHLLVMTVSPVACGVELGGPGVDGKLIKSTFKWI